jgi:hypothetical protein
MTDPEASTFVGNHDQPRTHEKSLHPDRTAADRLRLRGHHLRPDGLLHREFVREPVQRHQRQWCGGEWWCLLRLRHRGVDPDGEEATEMVSINNNGDVAGSMFLDEPNFILQPGYKRDGVWNPIGWFPASNPTESSFSTFSISPNGVWVTGQMSIGCCDFGTFKYNTETGVLTEIFDPAYVAVAGYVITNDGTIGGWADDEGLGGGTRRIPVYITPDLEIIPVGTTLPQFSTNAVNDINASSLMVGDFDNQPFIYDRGTDEFTTFDIPFGYIAATFTSVSNTGVAVGYAQKFGEFGSLLRDAIIYHPALGSQPRFLRDVLLINGLDVNAPNDRMGTAIAISLTGSTSPAGMISPPLPRTGGWCTSMEDVMMVSLYNAQGQRVAHHTLGSSSGVIDISALSIGVYTLRATTRDSSFVFNVVKE